MKISVVCVLCGKEISINADPNELDKPLIELFEGKAYALAVIGKDGETEVFGFICPTCFSKITQGQYIYKQYYNYKRSNTNK